MQLSTIAITISYTCITPHIPIVIWFYCFSWRRRVLSPSLKWGKQRYIAMLAKWNDILFAVLTKGKLAVHPSSSYKPATSSPASFARRGLVYPGLNEVCLAQNVG